MTSPGAGPFSPLVQMVRSEAFPGALLIVAAGVAMALANSPWSTEWEHLWHARFTVELGDYALSKPIHHWINDGLMALFFFFVGLEIKHEVLDGELQSMRQASLPIAGALGGMLVPAGLYALVVAAHGDATAQAGWGIPMATDIAFALGVLAVLGSRAPSSLKLFLATLAIVDDLGAVLVIAAFYTDHIEWQLLGVGLAILAVSYGLNRLGVRRTWPFVVLGILIWLTFLGSGVHATIAGTLLAFTVPARRQLDETEFARRARGLIDDFERVGDAHTPTTNHDQLEVIGELQQHASNVQAPLQRMERSLSPIVSHFILPLFALANAGVDVRVGLAEAARHAAAQGVFVGLVVGKVAGVLLAVWCARRWFGSTLPAGANWRQMVGVAFLAGIGFTMSLFVDSLAFANQPQAFHAAKIAVLAASVLSAVVGFAILARRTRQPVD